jgi:hypothetical protein
MTASNSSHTEPSEKVIEHQHEHSDLKDPTAVEAASPPFEEEEPVVTFKTWIVVLVSVSSSRVVWVENNLTGQILSLGYGLSFWPIPVMANIGGSVAAEFGAPEKYIWFIPVWTPKPNDLSSAAATDRLFRPGRPPSLSAS